MQGPTHTAREWERIAKESKGHDLFASYRLTALSPNRTAVLNEKGWRCRQDDCGAYVEFEAITWRRGRNGQPNQRLNEYQCKAHAKEFAQARGLEWPCHQPEPDELPMENGNGNK
jgi:hypothetical protein